MLMHTWQLKHLLGIDMPRASLPATIAYIAAHLRDINPVAVATGLLGIALLHGVKALNQRMCKALVFPEQLLLIAGEGGGGGGGEGQG